MKATQRGILNRKDAIAGVSNVFGLLSALLGAGIWYGFAWAAMAIPLIVIGRYVFRPGKA